MSKWVAVGTVKAIDVQEKIGVFVDVELEPNGEPLTCRVSSPYPGLYFPVTLESEWIILIPQDDTAAEPIAQAPLWSRAMVPPAGAATSPDQVWLDAGESGTVNIVGGRVNLGDGVLDPAQDGVVTRKMRCAYTGGFHPEASETVCAKE